MSHDSKIPAPHFEPQFMRPDRNDDIDGSTFAYTSRNVYATREHVCSVLGKTV